MIPVCAPPHLCRVTCCRVPTAGFPAIIRPSLPASRQAAAPVTTLRHQVADAACGSSHACARVMDNSDDASPEREGKASWMRCTSDAV